MKLSILSPNNFLKQLIRPLEKLGCKVLWNQVSDDCDFILGMSISQIENIEKAHKLFPNIPIVNYNWDLYEWHLKNPRPGEYDWMRYKEVLSWGKIWVPSEVTKRRTKELFGLESEVIKTFATLYDYPVKDGNYVLLPWREMPDECYGWAKQACEELRIPYKEPNKKLGWEDWKKTVAECTFIVSDHKEASTGSLSIVEAKYLGKPTLCNGSEYSAAKEYLWHNGEYFKTYDELKEKIQWMWENRKVIETKSVRKFLEREYSPETMAQRIHKKLCDIKGI